MKILFCVYRDWALDVVDRLVHEYEDVSYVTTQERLEKYVISKKYDVIILIGWSWKIPPEIINNNLVIGMHPSKLPEYAGGSPIQHQIIDGLTSSEATLFKLTNKFDDGELILSEPFSLSGNLSKVFESLSHATYRAIKRFIISYPNYSTTKQPSGGFTRRRLKPEDSKLSIEKIQTMSCKTLYDFIRCREDPYPNVFIEDESGTLFFKVVEFVSKV